MNAPDRASADTRLRMVGCTMRERAAKAGGKNPTASAAIAKIATLSPVPDSVPTNIVAMPAGNKKSDIVRLGTIRAVTTPETKTMTSGREIRQAEKCVRGGDSHAFLSGKIKRQHGVDADLGAHPHTNRKIITQNERMRTTGPTMPGWGLPRESPDPSEADEEDEAEHHPQAGHPQKRDPPNEPVSSPAATKGLATRPRGGPNC